MSTIKLIIADENQSYTKSLSQYLLEEYGQAFEIICFTQADFLFNYLEECGRADILLISPVLNNKALPLEKIKSVISFSENAEVGKNSIYKYQKADIIAKQLLEEYDKSSGCGVNMSRGSTKCKLVCVYSPSGAAGKTTIAYNLALQYSMQAKKALFISLESYSASTMFNQSSSSRGLIYLLYLIKGKLPNLMLKFNTIISADRNDNIHFIEREKNVLEYRDIKIDDFELLANFLKEQSDFDIVIFDLDSTINEIVLGAFKHCDTIINVQCSDSSSCAKQESFNLHISALSNLLEIDMSNKLINVRNKSEINIDNESGEEMGREKLIDIPYIKGVCNSLGAYFPEMTYFKQLYDAVEN